MNLHSLCLARGLNGKRDEFGLCEFYALASDKFLLQSIFGRQNFFKFYGIFLLNLLNFLFVFVKFWIQFHFALVVKWQTRYFQAVVSESSCEFKSRQAHQNLIPTTLQNCIQSK